MGKGQIELYTKPSRVVETGNIVILTDGKSYRISIVSKGHSGLTNDPYEMNADYGSDGIDTLAVDSIEEVKGRVNPLPSVTVPDLPVEDWRFTDIARHFVIESHATRQGGWPARGSKGFKQAAAEADKLALDNPDLFQSEFDNERIVTPPQILRRLVFLINGVG